MTPDEAAFAHATEQPPPAVSGGASRSPSRSVAPLLPGLRALLRGELSRWLGRRGLVHLVAWTVIISGALWFGTTQVSDSDWRGFDLLIHLWWLALPIGSIAIAQNALIEDRHNGTLPWMLSKPVSRPAYLLSRIVGDSVGIIVIGVLLQGLVAWIMLPALDPKVGLDIQRPDAGRYLAVIGIEALIVVLFVSLTILASTVFRVRGPVAGIGLAAWLFLWFSPFEFFERFTIGGLVSGEFSGRSFKPIAEYLVFDRPLAHDGAIGWTVAWIVLFTLAAIGILRREQF